MTPENTLETSILEQSRAICLRVNINSMPKKLYELQYIQTCCSQLIV